MSKIEFLSPEGLRIDGRRPLEIRKIICKLGIFSRADGSAYYQQGNTKAIAAVYGPREVSTKSKSIHDKAIISCEYSMATFSTGERKKTRKGDRRSTEISLIIKQTLESIIMVQLFPRSQIDIYVQILQADGGTRCAAINAACLAIINAGIPIRDFVVACAAGYIEGTPILDLNYLEDSAGGPDLPLAILPQSGKITMLQMDSKLPLEVFEKVLQLAIEGCKAIYNIMLQEVENYSQTLLKCKGISGI
jgi:exosome complex component RRP41